MKCLIVGLSPFCRPPMRLKRCFSENIDSAALAERNNPFASSKQLEAKAFPVQFTTGQNTLDEKSLITQCCFFNSRLFCICNCCVKDTHFLFFAQFVAEIHLATSSMTVHLKKPKPRPELDENF